MVKKILITRPNHDLITSYLHDFSKEIVYMLQNDKNFHVTDLEGDKATRENVNHSLVKEIPGLVFLNGHGDKKRVFGYKGEIILDSENVQNTKEKIIYALSCNSSEELGITAVKKGAKAYIGYTARFMMVLDPTRSGIPNKDRNALPFKRACHAMISSLVSGMKVKDAIENTKEEYRHSIKSYGTSEDDPYGDAPLIRFALTWNMEFLDLCGDPNAIFS
jgi:hypothetical protein